MDREARRIRRLGFAGGELAREPVERRAAGRHAAVRDEEPGHEMVVEEEARVGLGEVGRGEDVDRAAEFQQHVAGADDARAERRGDMVRGAADDRRSGRKPGFRRAPLRHVAEDLVRGDLRGIAARGRWASATSASSIAWVCEIDEAGLQRPVLLDRALAREPPVDVVVGAEHGRDAARRPRARGARSSAAWRRRAAG